jgi:hypothetical protein
MVGLRQPDTLGRMVSAAVVFVLSQLLAAVAATPRAFMLGHVRIQPAEGVESVGLPLMRSTRMSNRLSETAT